MKKILVSLLTMVSITVTAEPLKIVVPYSAGGPGDQTARYIAKKLTDQGTETVVLNKPTAGGQLALYDLLEKPDNKTLLLVGNGLVVAKALEDQKINEAVKKFVPIVYVSSYSNVLVASKSSNIKNWNEFQLALKSKKVNFAASSPASLLLVESLFKNDNTAFAPYNGDSKLLPDLIGGQIDVANITYPSAVPHIQSGKLVPLAVTTNHSINNIPSLTDLKVNFSTIGFYGLVASPSVTPGEQIAYYQQLNKILSTDESKEFMKNLHSTIPKYNTYADLAMLIQEEQQKLKKLLEKK